MWTPTSASEIEEAARTGALTETPSFDAKADLPANVKRNSDLAVDVAAMATDGGVLLYGVREDEHANPTIPAPIELAGAPERVSQIVSTSIAEVPFIEIRKFECPNDSARGYLVVVVPQSERAPHMVIVKGENRYYGRDATGNRPLNEADVARLYERRRAWQVDADRVLDAVIAAAPIEEAGVVHAVVRPLAGWPDLLTRSFAGLGGLEAQPAGLFAAAPLTKLKGGGISPGLYGGLHWTRRSADEWRMATVAEAEAASVEHFVEARFRRDGTGTMFCTRATDHIADGAVILERIIAGNVAQIVGMMSGIYAAAGYHGAVDVSVAVTGVRGAGSLARRGNMFRDAEWGYGDDDYRNTVRVAAAELVHPAEVTHRLLGDFYEATSGFTGYSPFEE